jgi:hypothetical protein
MEGSDRWWRANAHGRGVLLVTAVVLGASCVAEPGSSPDRASPAPVVTPSSAYAAFDYSSPTQRATFQAFLACAARHGLTYEGPFSDSTGSGVYLRLAAGEHATDAEQQEVNDACPEGTVAVFGTPVGHVDEKRFASAATDLSSCIRDHGISRFPDPPTGGDPVAAFWKLPFDWSDPSFVDAIGSCVGTLRSYLFPR